VQKNGLIVIFCTVAAVSGQTVLLSPKSVVEYAIHNNVGIQSLKYTVESNRLAVDNAFAGFLPGVKGKGLYYRLDKVPTFSFGGGGSLVLPDSTHPNYQQEKVVIPIVYEVLGELMPSSGTISAAPLDNWDLGVSINQPIFMGGSILNGYRAAVQTWKSSDYSADRNVQSVREAALQMFWTYVGLGEKIRVTRDNISWTENMVADQTMLVHEGAILESDIFKMKTQLDLARLGEKQQQNAILGVEDQIKIFCRISRNSAFIVDSNSLLVLGNEGTAPAPDTEKILNQRADIKALKAQIEAVQFEKKAQLGRYLPGLTGSYSYDYKNNDLTRQNTLIGGWTLSAALDWTLWDWGSIYRSSQQTEIALAQLKLALESKKDSVYADLASVCRTITEKTEAQKLALESVDYAQQVLVKTELQYKEGQITSTDLLSARKDLTEARQELVNARIEKALAIEQYRLVAGEE
jgi:outer membrane protein TolC